MKRLTDPTEVHWTIPWWTRVILWFRPGLSSVDFGHDPKNAVTYKTLGKRIYVISKNPPTKEARR